MKFIAFRKVCVILNIVIFRTSNPVKSPTRKTDGEGNTYPGFSPSLADSSLPMPAIDQTQLEAN